MAYTPAIGLSGIYKLKTPYDQLVTPKVVALAAHTKRYFRWEDPFVTYYIASLGTEPS